MKTIKKITLNERLSSDYLYHYKDNFDVVKLIIKNGFQHRLWDEDIPFPETKQFNYITSFCDIMWKDNDFHKSVYGDYVFIMKKKWAIVHMITPVSYMHEKSPMMSDGWFIRKYLQRLVRISIIPKYCSNPSLKQYLNCIEIIEKEISNKRIMKSNFISIVRDSKWEKNFEKKIQSKLKKPKKYPDEFGNGFNALYEELEKRDTLSRIFNGPFENGRASFDDKIFYDEREWRSYSMPTTMKEAVYGQKNHHLYKKRNVKFCDDDVEMIIVQGNKEKKDLESYILNNKTLLTSKSFNKIFTIGRAKKAIDKRIKNGEVF